MTEQLRTYLDMVIHHINSEPAPVLTEGDVLAEETRSILKENLQEAVFKMRSYSDDTGGDYSLGFESGLEMAATMIENILKTVEGQ